MRVLLVGGPAHGGIWENTDYPSTLPQVTHTHEMTEHLYDRWVSSAPASDGSYDAVFIHSSVAPALVDQHCKAALLERENSV